MIGSTMDQRSQPPGVGRRQFRFTADCQQHPKQTTTVGEKVWTERSVAGYLFRTCRAISGRQELVFMSGGCPVESRQHNLDIAVERFRPGVERDEVQPSRIPLLQLDGSRMIGGVPEVAPQPDVTEMVEWPEVLSQFVKVMPTDYKRVLTERRRHDEEIESTIRDAEQTGSFAGAAIPTSSTRSTP